MSAAEAFWLGFQVGWCVGDPSLWTIPFAFAHGEVTGGANMLDSDDDILSELFVETLLDAIDVTGELLELDQLVGPTDGTWSHAVTPLLVRVAVFQKVSVKQLRNHKDQSESLWNIELIAGLLPCLVVPHTIAGPEGSSPNGRSSDTVWIVGEDIPKQPGIVQVDLVFVGMHSFAVRLCIWFALERHSRLVNLWWTLLGKGSQVVHDGMDLLVGPGGGIPSHLQSWSSLWMMQEGIHLHSEIPFSAGI